MKQGIMQIVYFFPSLHFGLRFAAVKNDLSFEHLVGALKLQFPSAQWDGFMWTIPCTPYNIIQALRFARQHDLRIHRKVYFSSQKLSMAKILQVVREAILLFYVISGGKQ